MDNYQFHKPVLLQEVLENLAPRDGEVYVDATFGAGGYSKAVLESANCVVYAFDRDKSVERFVKPLKEKFGSRFHFINRPFSEMEILTKELNVHGVDGILLDLGVSSMQLDEEERGFSFNSAHPLDMRMDSSSKITAFNVVNEMEENELAKIIRDFGEEPKSKIIAKKIVENRNKQEIKTALELANIIRKVYGFKSGKIDPATKTFQAIRIFVNDELGELKKVLEISKKLLKKNGRLIAVSFHSLEDSIVKSFLRTESGYNDRNVSRYNPLPLDMTQKQYAFSLLKNSSIKPSEEELRENIRARSARMRVAIKN